MHIHPHPNVCTYAHAQNAYASMHARSHVHACAQRACTHARPHAHPHVLKECVSLHAPYTHTHACTRTHVFKERVRQHLQAPRLLAGCQRARQQQPQRHERLRDLRQRGALLKQPLQQLLRCHCMWSQHVRGVVTACGRCGHSMREGATAGGI